jgi:hypothetical protein
MMINNIAHFTIFGVQLINPYDCGQMLIRLGMNIFFVLIIIRMIFYPIYREINYVFTTILINITVFLICFLLGSIKLKIGCAFGLFAVFSILRYRTEQIPIREMTYLFTVIIIAVLNALSDDKTSYAELLIANVTIVLAVILLEKNFFQRCERNKTITYEKIELIKPDNYPILINDLKERTGLNILKADVMNINFLNDTAQVKILYQSPICYPGKTEEK